MANPASVCLNRPTTQNEWRSGGSMQPAIPTRMAIRPTPHDRTGHGTANGGWHRSSGWHRESGWHRKGFHGGWHRQIGDAFRVVNEPRGQSANRRRHIRLSAGVAMAARLSSHRHTSADSAAPSIHRVTTTQRKPQCLPIRNNRNDCNHRSYLNHQKDHS